MSTIKSALIVSMLALLLTAMFPGYAANKVPLRLCFEDAEQKPWTHPDGTGLNFELLKRVEAITGESFSFHALPWKRCLGYVASGEFDGVIGAAISAERKQYGVYPQDEHGRELVAANLYSTDFNIFVRRDSPITWDGRQFKNLSGQVAAQAGFVVALTLRELGYTVNEQSKTAENGLRLLHAQVVDAAVLQGHQSLQLQRKYPRFSQSLKVLPLPFSKFPLYLMIAKVRYNKDPQRIQAIWRAIEKERATISYKAREKEALQID